MAEHLIVVQDVAGSSPVIHPPNLNLYIGVFCFLTQCHYFITLFHMEFAESHILMMSDTPLVDY